MKIFNIVGCEFKFAKILRFLSLSNIKSNVLFGKKSDKLYFVKKISIFAI